ncbi:hypothetical protein LTR64_001441 [Lithohypha guttulata]|uniref:uncharacterized protein n=1 Tax=Lithohypha guttulata TaxID=1690604 RepID=UPI00315C7B00
MSEGPVEIDGGHVPALNFHQRFRQEISTLRESIDTLAIPDLTASERQASNDQVLAGLAKLSAELADASGNLPSYDQRSYNQALKELYDKLAITRASQTPKPKFSFKNKRLAAPVSETNSDSPMPALPSPASHSEYGRNPGRNVLEQRVSADTSMIQDRDHFAVVGRSNTYVGIATITAPGIIDAAGGAQGCIVSDTADSIVDLSPHSNINPPPFLTITSVQSSLLLAPSIKGPAHITALHRSILVLSSHQFRMHDSHEVDVYLFCSSRPIIENCSNIRFASMPSRFIDTTDLRNRTNMFDQVDDFKWLRAEPSPNWSLMDDEEQISDGVWSDVLQIVHRLHDDTPEAGKVLVKEAVGGVLSKLGKSSRATS